MEDLTVELSDGRDLGFAEYGTPEGTPVLYFHGGQESRLSARFLDEPARSAGIRIIAPERPGIGLSSPQPGRQFRDWASDIEEVADELGIEEFRMIGLSGGAPHALAVAEAMPTRALRAAIVSGAAPSDAPRSFRGMWFPVRMIHWFAGMRSQRPLESFLKQDSRSLAEQPDARISQFQKYLPKPDRNLLTSQPHYAHEFIAGSIESYRQGIDGVAQEYRLYVADWGIDMSSIQVPIDLWYGTDDRMAPVDRGRFYASVLPHAQLRILEDEAHFSLIRKHSSAILQELMRVDE